jgi:hypothetical protein
VYRKLGVQVLGYDISEDMIAEARSKIESGDPIEVGVKGFFEIEDDVTPDVLVSIRFLRWLDWDDVERFFERVEEWGVQTVIVGVRHKEKALSADRGVRRNTVGVFGETRRLIRRSLRVLRAEGPGGMVKKGWAYVASKANRALALVRGEDTITRHGKQQIERLIRDAGYDIERREKIRQFSGREQYDIFLLSRGKT